jgi:hypothetical protein
MTQKQNSHQIKTRKTQYMSGQSCPSEIVDAGCTNIAQHQQTSSNNSTAASVSTTNIIINNNNNTSGTSNNSISSKLSINNLLCTPQDIKKNNFQ